MNACNLPLFGYTAMASRVFFVQMTDLLGDQFFAYLNVYPRKSSCASGLASWYNLVFWGLSHSPLSFKNASMAGWTYLSSMFLLRVITMKSSAYLTQVVDKDIFRFSPSFSLTCLRCSLDLVSGYIDLLTATSRPLSVKLANVGELILPCGVPVMRSTNFPSSNTLAFSH